jgi:osmotically-inducible protein OsmY
MVPESSAEQTLLQVLSALICLDKLTFRSKAVPTENGELMKSLVLGSALFLLAALGNLTGCSDSMQKSPDVAESIRNSLSQAGLKDVSVSQDRDKGVVTLGGTTATPLEKSQAESIARGIASSQVIANEIAVRPVGDESIAKTVDSDTDKAIDKNFHAVLVKNKLNTDVKYDVKNGVVTLTGHVNSQSKRSMVERLASDVPNVKQVVNELEVKGQKATAS